MKVTKRQLRRIIKEVKQKLLAESRIRNAVRKALNEEAGGFGSKRGAATPTASLGKGFVAERIFGIYDLAYDDDGQIVDTTGRELREDEWLQEDWEEGRNIDAVVASLKKLGVTHIGGDVGSVAIDELNLDVPSEDFAPIDDVARFIKMEFGG